MKIKKWKSKRPMENQNQTVSETVSKIKSKDQWKINTNWQLFESFVCKHKHPSYIR